MAGQWFYRPERDTWCLFSRGREEITISTEALHEACRRNGLSRRQALEWIASRPRRPWGQKAA